MPRSRPYAQATRASGKKMDLDVQVAKLKVLRSDYQNQKYRLEDKLLKALPRRKFRKRRTVLRL